MAGFGGWGFGLGVRGWGDGVGFESATSRPAIRVCGLEFGVTCVLASILQYPLGPQ